MSIEEIIEELIKLSNHEHTNIDGVEYLFFSRRNQFSFEDIKCENYAISLFSLKEFASTKDLSKLRFRKLNIKNRYVIDKMGGEFYFDMFMSTMLSKENSELLIECFNEKRLIPMFMKVRH